MQTMTMLLLSLSNVAYFAAGNVAKNAGKLAAKGQIVRTLDGEVMAQTDVRDEREARNCMLWAIRANDPFQQA